MERDEGDRGLRLTDGAKVSAHSVELAMLGRKAADVRSRCRRNGRTGSRDDEAGIDVIVDVAKKAADSTDAGGDGPRRRGHC